MPRRYPSLRTFRAAYISQELGALWRGGDECCICLDRYDNSTHRPVGVTSNWECEHVFGRRCLGSYLDSTNPSRHTCPVCRRKWYSRRPTNPRTPRDTNTSHVLSARTPHGTPMREGADLRNLLRIDTRIGRAVEELIKSMEALEALERRETIRLDQNSRVQLQHVQGRIHTFLSRHVSASDSSSNHGLRRQTRAIGYSTAGSSVGQHEGAAVAGLDNGPRPYPLSSAAFQVSTVSLPELRSHVQRCPQLTSTPTPTMPPSADYFRESLALDKHFSQSNDANASPVPTVRPRTEATAQIGYRNNMALPQPSSRVRHEVNTRGLRDHLRTIRHSRSRDTSIPASGPRNTSHISLPDIAELESDTPLTDRPLQHPHQHSVQAHAHMNEQAPILYPRSQTPFLHRAHSTQGLYQGTQPVNTPQILRLTPQTSILAASTTERGEGSRSRAAVTSSTRGLSCVMSISNLRGIMTSNRSR
jgi:hypothetical protein